MADLIERDKAIEAVEELDIPEDMCVFEILSHIEVALGTLPSAQPKMGKWYRGEAYPHHLYCSICYRTALPNDEYVERWNLHMNYCPNCGAKMEVE